MENSNLTVSAKAIEKACSKVKDFLDGIVDKGSFVETDVFVTGKGFDDAASALGEGVVTGYATVNGSPFHVFAQNAEVLKGSLGKAHADKIVRCMQRAVKTGTPLISVIDCAGARVGEGVSVLEGFAKVLSEAAIVSGQVPHFCIVKGNAVGMMASFVAMADFVFMSEGAIMSVNSPMYLASKEKDYPKYTDMIGFKAHKKGSDLAQFVYKSEADLKKQLTQLTSILLAADEEEATDDPNRVTSALNKECSAAVKVKAVADNGEYVEYCKEWAPEVTCALAKINGISVGIAATDSKVGDGYITLDGVKKLTSFIEKLDGFDIPLVTLVDTLGVNPALSEELAGAAKVTGDLIATVANSSIDKIGVAVGKAIGFGYSALMSKGIGFDYTLATQNAVISPISGETAVNALMSEQLSKAKDVEKTRAKLADEYAKIEANPMLGAQEGYIDNVVEAKNLRPYIASALMMLMGI